MNSGLYALAGDCATAMEAACAKRLLGPTTKVSKVYFRLSLRSALKSRRRVTVTPGLGRAVGSASTPDRTHRTEMGRPSRPLAVSSISRR